MSDFKVTELDAATNFSALSHWDVVIIGAGPAGLAAGLTTAHRGLTTMIIEAKAEPGGQPQFLYADKKIVDIPGFPDGITGQELSDRTYRQAVDALVQFRFEEELLEIQETTESLHDEPLRKVVTNRGSYLCRKVILACGLLHYPRRLPVLDALNSRKVSYRIPRQNDYQGDRVLIVGGGDSAFDAAVMILQRNGAVDLLIRGEQPAAKADTVARVRSLGGHIHLQAQVESATVEEGQVVSVLNTGEQLVSDLAVVQIGYLSARETFERLDLRLNDDGSVAIDPYFETNRKGIFAVGDVHGDIKLITVAWAEGIQAAIYAFKEISSPYWLNEKRLRDQKLLMIGEKLTNAAGHVSRRPNSR
ncbi:MAG: NAD(P)/FAD-dependent oxidoreductase [Planctomycetaceae bacterium]|nr:NAD(P)/FAD-dependent oxidoreductase [Planctomycetaceae bacterium]